MASCAWRYFDFYARASRRIPRAPEQRRLRKRNDQIAWKIDNMLQLEVGDAQKRVTKLATENFQRFIHHTNIYSEF